MEDALSCEVQLIQAPDCIGLSDEAKLCLPVTLSFNPDIVLGHGHVTGPAAFARKEFLHPNAKRIHFLHTLPEELEWHKSHHDSDPAQRAVQKQELETRLSISSDLAVAVGPRLERNWNIHIDGISHDTVVMSSEVSLSQ